VRVNVILTASDGEPACMKEAFLKALMVKRFRSSISWWSTLMQPKPAFLGLTEKKNRRPLRVYLVNSKIRQ
jgi:hypothetical protein